MIEKKVTLHPDMPFCQMDYPLDWYQEKFIPYAEEYLALPDRKIETVVKWMKKYIDPAVLYFGDKLLLLAHYYMGGDIVKLVQTFGGQIGDSYQLAVMVSKMPEKKIIVESAVHFMAESISILANKDQYVYITNPKAGCTMEMNAKDYMVEPAFESLNERYGSENILPICYMNTSGRIKALTGAQGGSVCTSSNVKKIVEWGIKKNKKIFFVPDKCMGENVASMLGISADELAYWPAGVESAQFNLSEQNTKFLEKLDRSKMVLFGSYCAVHTYFEPEMVKYWKDKGFNVVVHPECKKITVDEADCCGSTAFIFDHVFYDKAHTKKYAIGTENHMVQNMKQLCLAKEIEVVNVGDAPISKFKAIGCGCATMSRNDPPHLVGTLDLLMRGIDLAENRVLPGDVVDHVTGNRERLDIDGQEFVAKYAKIAMENMIEITEQK